MLWPKPGCSFKQPAKKGQRLAALRIGEGRHFAPSQQVSGICIQALNVQAFPLDVEQAQIRPGSDQLTAEKILLGDARGL